MAEESLFDRADRLRTYIKRLKSEERLLAAQMPALRQMDLEDVHVCGGTCSSAHVEAAGQERLNELRYLVWETAAELESVFLELAQGEVERLATFAESTPAGDLGTTCSAAGNAIIARFADAHGGLMNKNNNVAHLLTHFSNQLELNDLREATPCSSDSGNVTVLRDETQTRVYGVRVNGREVRFVDIDKGMDTFRTTVIAAIEEWQKKRLAWVERRAELRALMERPPSATSDTAHP